MDCFYINLINIIKIELMKKFSTIFLLLFVFCGESGQTIDDYETSTQTSNEVLIETEESSTSTTEIVQLDSFKGIVYVVQNDAREVGYLAP